MLPASDLVEIVGNDLAFLRDEWDHQVDDHSLRRSSVILRRLLVDNELQRAWKAAGFEREPQIVASTLEGILKLIPLEKLGFASAGGAKYRGGEARGALKADFAMSPEQVKELYAAGTPNAAQGLRSFIEAPCVVIKG